MQELSARIAGIDWAALADQLDTRGWARTPRPLLAAGECRTIARSWSDDGAFRSSVDLAQHRYGDRGSYRYFARPLPPLVQELREGLYPPLARIANHWQQQLGAEERFPPTHAGFLERCAAAGQTRPTPLVLRYEAGGYNCLHQDRYGAVAFPLQVVILLSRPGVDFTGGEFLLTEQRPRAQSRGTAVSLERGVAVVFPNAERPVAGSRGVYRATSRHGVSELASGVRLSFGLIFHDAA